MGKFERKFGKYAIKNLSLILVICYAIGYLFSLIPILEPVLNYLTLNPYMIIHGQVWRLVTWIIVPPLGGSFSLLTFITLYFYYSIGRSLENTWGDYLYNVYIFTGILFTIIGSFFIYLYFSLKTGDSSYYVYYMDDISKLFSTYYVNMSIFLAFAATFPEAQVLLMFIIPIKVKWLGFAYGGLLIYEFLSSGLVARVVIFVSLLNFIVFFVVQRYTKYGSLKNRAHQAVRRKQFRKEVRKENTFNGISKHKCAICGRTDTDYPDLEFRFCSKCNGNYEYCSDHLFTHKHVE